MQANKEPPRQPVGILPYRVPPLSGLYRLRYVPPSSPLPPVNHVVLLGETTDPSTGTDVHEQRHREVHAQLLRASALEDGQVDLFTLYSVCEVEPVVCTHCSLHMDTTLQTCSYHLRETYHIRNDQAVEERREEGLSSMPSSALISELQRGWYAFFFPLSECGRLKGNLLVCVSGALMAGDVAECDVAHGGWLRPLKKEKNVSAAPAKINPAAKTFVSVHGKEEAADVQSGAAAAAAKLNATPSPTSTASVHAKPLFYYVVSPISIHRKRTASTASSPSDLDITVTWRSFPAHDGASSKTEKKMFTLLYPYYCAPRTPNRLTCRAQFSSPTRLRLVRSPNCSGAVQLRSQVTEHAASIQVETIDGTPLALHRHPKDYIFQLCFFFGDYTGLMEETSMVAAFVVAAVFMVGLWFFLTKDLVV